MDWKLLHIPYSTDVMIKISMF